ncbi:hypothetical protein ACFQ07_09460, partial [Actinomadura adrarensis]
MRKFVYGGLGVMVLATGGYTVVYLARWEWQRSLMAGELLLVCLIVLLAVAGAHRLQAMERRLTELLERRDRSAGHSLGSSEPSVTAEAGTTEAGTAEAGTAEAGTAEERAPRFRWLEADSHSYKVFIPVLLGAGIIVSGLAALVERVSSALGERSAPAR